MSVSLVDSAVPISGLVAGNNAKLGSVPRILVADDDPRILATVARFLTKAGFAVQKLQRRRGVAGNRE